MKEINIENAYKIRPLISNENLILQIPLKSILEILDGQCALDFENNEKEELCEDYINEMHYGININLNKEYHKNFAELVAMNLLYEKDHWNDISSPLFDLLFDIIKQTFLENQEMFKVTPAG